MTFPSIRIEGAILSGDLLTKLDKGDFTGQRPADFGFDSQPKLKEEIVRAWTAAQAFYTAFQHKLEGVKEGNAATSETRNQWIIPLLGLLGYAELEFQSQSELVGDKPFRLSHHLRSHGGFHVHIVGARESLDKKPVTGPRVSPHAHLQEYLNLTEHLYGIVTNGKLLRLLRDSTRLIKLSYVEFDLDRMFGEELFADFAVLYRLLHVTRLPRSPEKSSESLLERYHQDALESGARIRDGLSFAVEQVVQELGSGFLARNENLRNAVADNSVTARELHHALLRLIYRLLLMMVAEERGLLFTDVATPRQRKLYLDHYSIGRLRRLAERRALADSTKHDLWRGLRSTFRLFETDGPGAPLGLTGLGGQLFSAAALGPLQSAELDNGTLLSSLAKLSLFRQPDTGQLSRVNYGALATEEFGSVYERLLELHPVINPAAGNLSPTFGFKQAAGNERKTSGSYYTPSSLVECLLDSALDPVLDDRLKNFAKLGYKSADEAVLALKVCDPACGSGHFLIAAAQRIARRLALLRSKGDEPSVSELRHTLREVIGHCIYGVDINPMSVELCKVGLWLEAMEAGKPLSFLDHHIRCGNSLLGATPALIAEGIPDDAFNAIEGDDKKACAALKKLNAREKLGFGELFALEDSATFERLQQAAVVVENLPDDSVRAVEQKSFAFEQLQHNYDFERATDLANLWCAAFVIPKGMADGELRLEQAPVGIADESSPASTQAGLFGESFAAPTTKPKATAKSSVAPSTLAEAHGITSGHLRAFAKGEPLPEGLFGETRRLARRYNLFHWHLAFPEVFKCDGFDVVLGNPPWEKINLKDVEFFAETHPHIANAANKAERKRFLEQLRIDEPSAYASYELEKEMHDRTSHFFRFSGYFPFTGVSRINLYSVFCETALRILNRKGRSGLVLASGIVTDDNNKDLFTSLIDGQQLIHAWDFENREGIFPDVDSRFKLCLVCAGGKDTKQSQADFAFYLTRMEHLSEPDRHFSLSAQELLLLNPVSRTCPTFRNKREAEITKSIYRVVPAWALHEKTSAWPGLPKTPFNMSNDSALFLDKTDMGELPASETVFLPLYESKFIHQFNHRFATFTADFEAGAQELSPTQLNDSSRFVDSRYWIPKRILDQRFPGRWFLVYRKITCATNERTSISTIIPEAPCGDSLILIEDVAAPAAAVLNSILNSFAYDYCARQKVGGTNFNHWIWHQLPIPSATQIDSSCAWSGDTHTLKDWLLPRALELTYTAWDLEAFAQDCGWFGPPFRWDEDRRFQLRCELDAAFFHLYGLDRDDTAYILDTFPIVKRKDEEKFGTYRTKDRILELYDALAEAQRTSKAFDSPLNPAPASMAVAHPWNWEGKALELPVTPRTPLPESWQYVVNVMVELLWQAGGSLPWRILRTATDLLSDRRRLARLAELHVGQVALDWQALNGDVFDATHRWDQLSGFCHAGKMRVVRRNDELMVELLSADRHVLFPHVRFDARLALTVARSQPVTTPTPAEAKEERRVAELIPA